MAVGDQYLKKKKPLFVTYTLRNYFLRISQLVNKLGSEQMVTDGMHPKAERVNGLAQGQLFNTGV